MVGILSDPILSKKGIISGVKPHAKNRPEIELPFDKTKPLGPYNFPTFSYADYWITGYREDAAGIRHSVQFKERLPVGQRVRLNKNDYPGITITGCSRALGGPRLK